ncbi:hypothetical protein EVA_04176 [gut metagenome]|uniref:Uncharacterized protein n=1 Tax=gut metagenome TaxID=749906 RepID=J9GXB2_9ZZZZ
MRNFLKPLTLSICKDTYFYINGKTISAFFSAHFPFLP